jgi:DNA primase large subunit
MQDLMFVLREALARIRILSARMNELALLRQKYLTKITDSAKNKIQYGFGGEDQEIFCSLGSQVTVVLRLTNDCPILKGSVYIQRIVGCGGWEENVLQKMKVKVNEMKMSGPVELMDALVEEIERIVEEEGVKMPKTPVLPSRRN